MKLFSKNETLGVLVILTVIITVTVFNLRIALRRSRDEQRRADIGAISDALNTYQKDFGFFPPATNDGEILACKGDNFGNFPKDLNDSNKMSIFFSMLRGCDWGKDSLRDVTDESYPPYLEKIPTDPYSDQGVSYYYFSDMKRYQLYAFLEGGNDEVGFRQGVVDRKISCGNKICNFGKAYSDAPLEKTLEEYENELIEKSKQK